MICTFGKDFIASRPKAMINPDRRDCRLDLIRCLGKQIRSRDADLSDLQSRIKVHVVDMMILPVKSIGLLNAFIERSSTDVLI